MKSLAEMVRDAKGTSPDQVHVGVVVDNNDPEKLQRVRVFISGLLDSEDYSKLPWVLPDFQSPYGMGDNYGIVNIPRIGSRVGVWFQEGNVDFGFWTNASVSGQMTLPDEFTTNYPNRVGFFTPAGDIAYIDFTTLELLYRRASGTAIQIDQEGNVVINVAGDLTQIVKGDYNLSVDGSMNVIVNGDAARNVKGKDGTQVGGDSTTVIQGNQSVQTSGQRNISCSSENHSGDMNVSSDVVASGVSLVNHTHGGVDTGGGHTAPPD